MTYFKKMFSILSIRARRSGLPDATTLSDDNVPKEDRAFSAVLLAPESDTLTIRQLTDAVARISPAPT